MPRHGDFELVVQKDADSEGYLVAVTRPGRVWHFTMPKSSKPYMPMREAVLGPFPSEEEAIERVTAGIDEGYFER